MDSTEQTIISIATGTAGLERGLENVGLKIRIAAFVEIEAFIIANLVAAMEACKMDTVPIWADVKTFPAKYFRGKIHGITAGYPCQPFSKSGKRIGSDDKRHIFPDILRIISTIKPVWCFFENVEGHISLGYGEIYRSLRNLGYKIEAGIFSAEEVGAPHQRKRLFILAIKMEYTNASEIKGKLFRDVTTFSSSRSSGSLANSHTNDRRSNSNEFQGKAKEIEAETQRQDRKWCRSKFSNSSFPMANTDSSGIDKSCKRRSSKFVNKDVKEWAAQPGQKQFDWEEPRTTKSGMGCTVDGYDFRIDLLRALGNGVVPQTASKAFVTLLEKF